MAGSLLSGGKTATSITKIPLWSSSPLGELDDKQNAEVKSLGIVQTVRRREGKGGWNMPGRWVQCSTGQPGEAIAVGRLGPPKTPMLESYLPGFQNVTLVGDWVCTELKSCHCDGSSSKTGVLIRTANSETTQEEHHLNMATVASNRGERPGTDSHSQPSEGTDPSNTFISDFQSRNYNSSLWDFVMRVLGNE